MSAYEMRLSDLSSVVCSSDLVDHMVKLVTGRIKNPFIVQDLIIPSQQDRESLFVPYLIPVFLLIQHIFLRRNNEVHCLWLVECCGKNEEGDQEETKVHHGRHINSGRTLLSPYRFLSTFFLTLASFYISHDICFFFVKSFNDGHLLAFTGSYQFELILDRKS